MMLRNKIHGFVSILAPLHLPALNRGRVQTLVQRGLLTLGGTMTTSQAVEWAYCRKRLLQGRRIERHDYRAARRALDHIAERIGRAKTIGRPWIWRLKGVSN